MFVLSSSLGKDTWEIIILLSILTHDLLLLLLFYTDKKQPFSENCLFFNTVPLALELVVNLFVILDSMVFSLSYRFATRRLSHFYSNSVFMDGKIVLKHPFLSLYWFCVWTIFCSLWNMKRLANKNWCLILSFLFYDRHRIMRLFDLLIKNDKA